jgi:hypothetical protein
MSIPRPLQLSIAALVTFGLTAIAAPTASASPHLPIPIELARHLPLGTTVTVIGSVTVQSNAFDPGFAVQGVIDGIYVLDSGTAARNLGDLVEITGPLTDNFGLLSIQPTSITTFAHAPSIAPHHRSSTGSIGEATEGRLLRLKGEMVGDLVDDGPFGFKLDIDDGSGPIQLFLYPGTGISTAGLEAGATIDVVCFSNQFDTHYECDPRRPADLTIE